MKAVSRYTTASLLALGWLIPASARAQAAAAQEPVSSFELSVANIMRGPEHVGEPPTAIRWTDDGRWIYFLWKPGGRPGGGGRCLLHRLCYAGFRHFGLG